MGLRNHSESGARLIITYQNERGKAGGKLASTLPDATLYPCNVASDEEVVNLSSQLRRILEYCMVCT